MLTFLRWLLRAMALLIVVSVWYFLPVILRTPSRLLGVLLIAVISGAMFAAFVLLIVSAFIGGPSMPKWFAAKQRAAGNASITLQCSACQQAPGMTYCTRHQRLFCQACAGEHQQADCSFAEVKPRIPLYSSIPIQKGGKHGTTTSKAGS